MVNGTHTDFDRHFRDSAIPRLQRRALRLARGIAQGRWSYADALESLCRRAVQLGATYCADFYDIESYLADLLADLTDKNQAD